jgi:N utilization substance protein A
MNSELQAIFNYMERDRGIERETLIVAVEQAIQAAARKSVTAERDLRIVIDRETFDIMAFSDRLVVEEVDNKLREISVEDAQEFQAGAELGDIVEVKVESRNLGRIAAQTAKQAIMQKIKQAERDIVYEEYKDRVGDIVSGTVRQFNRSDIIVDLGRTEGTMGSRERVPTEEYQVGDRIRAYIVSVHNNAGGPSILLSRSHPNFVRRLFELEVSEIADELVEIKTLAREPGFRTKIAVVSNDPKVDPVGACVGMRGMRVKNIVRELSGEKIDIIRWSEDIKEYVTNSLSPAKLNKVEIVEVNGEQVMRVTVDADQLSLAIGKRGQNVRLSAKLVGCKVDIQKDEKDITFEEKVERAVHSLAAIEGVSQDQAQALVNAGFLTIEGILALNAEELAETIDITPAEAEAIQTAASAQSDT